MSIEPGQRIVIRSDAKSALPGVSPRPMVTEIALMQYGLITLYFYGE
jgi:hypothetical protein